jgi:hypothetical protein
MSTTDTNNTNNTNDNANVTNLPAAEVSRPEALEAREEPTSDEAANRHAGVGYRLEGRRGRRARRRAARALKSLDRALVRLAKQTASTIAWKRHAEKALVHQDALADQPTSFALHVARKVGVTVAELGFTYAALDLAGIRSRNLRMMLAVALAGLLVLLGQTIARTMKRAHLAFRQDDPEPDEDDDGELAVEPPSTWDWSLVAVSMAFLIAFAAALTTLRESYNHALEKAQAAAVASNSTQLTVAAPQHTVPGWVLAALALVAPLIAILAEYAQYHPHAHRLRRSLRLYAWNARKLRYVLRRCGQPVHRGRRALLAFDNLRSRALRMKHVIHAAHGGAEPADGQLMLNADEPVRQLRNRLQWYDAAAELARKALLEPHGGEVKAAADDELERLCAFLAATQTQSPNGKPGPEAVA